VIDIIGNGLAIEGELVSRYCHQKKLYCHQKKLCYSEGRTSSHALAFPSLTSPSEPFQILFVFGWAEWQPGGGLVAPWKWWYCMFAVVVFLAGIEVFKLLALRFVVWMKR